MHRLCTGYAQASHDSSPARKASHDSSPARTLSDGGHIHILPVHRLCIGYEQAMLRLHTTLLLPERLHTASHSRPGPGHFAKRAAPGSARHGGGVAGSRSAQASKSTPLRRRALGGWPPRPLAFPAAGGHGMGLAAGAGLAARAQQRPRVSGRGGPPGAVRNARPLLEPKWLTNKT